MTDSMGTGPPVPEDERWSEGLAARPGRRRRERKPPSREVKLYAVPRRFDIATLLVVSLAYSLLFTLLRLSGTHWGVAAFTGGLTMAVGIAQGLFPYGNGPRNASIVAGAGYVAIWAGVLAALYENVLMFVAMVLFSLLLTGPVVGYLCGAVVAGVFLVADKVRRRWFGERHAAAATEAAGSAEEPHPLADDGPQA